MINRKLVLRFPKESVDKPIIWKLVKEFDLMFNILKATITSRHGIMVLEIFGRKRDFEEGLKYLKKQRVIIEPLSKDVKRNEKKCTHCGECIIICPVEALYMIKGTGEVKFDSKKCIGCELCVPVCPFNAMEVHF